MFEYATTKLNAKETLNLANNLKKLSLKWQAKAPTLAKIFKLEAIKLMHMGNFKQTKEIIKIKHVSKKRKLFISRF